MLEINPRWKQPNPASEGDSSQFVAQNYNNWKIGLPFETNLPPARQLPSILAVGGGKGGVGKSIVSANLAATLAQFGYRVLVIDLDLGCSNLHSHFGVAMPKKTLADFVLTQKAAFRDVIVPAPVQGVAFIAGGREESWADYLDKPSDYLLPLWQSIVVSRQQLKVDFVLIDLGAGTHGYTMDFFTSAHLGLVTVLPEPTSIENAYVFFKMTLWTLIDSLAQRYKLPQVAVDIKANLASMAGATLASGYASCLKNLQSRYPQFIQDLQRTVQARCLGILINQTRDQTDIDLGNSMEHISQKYFGLPTKYLGHLNYDDAVLKSLKNRRLLVSDFPHSMIAKRLSTAAAQSLKILGMQRRN
ncbi:MAG: AAA family ATPase [Proteobacteria bacterium]|nr:AAA family ATPase [Pseudomonadota bacterium]